MATAYSDLCRLCARKNEFSKDLLDKNNKNMLDLIHQFMQIAVTENDSLPTKVCLDCEEKMVSFQLYILQCYKVQDYLNMICLENKANVGEIEFSIDVKPEVKRELTNDDLFNEINDDSITDLGHDTFQNDDFGSDIDDDDDITIASLKQKKSRPMHHKTQLAVEFNRVLNKPILDISDIVKLECTNCVLPFMTWGDLCSHYAVTHDTTPIIHCLCGGTINSSSALNKHFMLHKKLNNEVTVDKIEGNPEDTNDINQQNDNEDKTLLISLKENKEITEEEKTQLNELQKQVFKVKDIIKFNCSFCEESLKSWGSLRSHYEHVHNSSPRASCLCGYIIRSTFTLHKHYASHKKYTRKKQKTPKNSKGKGPKSKDYDALRVQDYVQFTCIHCNRECFSWYKLKSHTERVHKVPLEVFCLSCGLSIKSKTVMYKHVQDHNNPTELSCDQCSLRCKSMEALNKHKLKHVPKSERKFECPNCDKVFSCKDGLNSHIKSHIPLEERKVYQCDKCEMRFVSKSAMTSHARIVHEKIKSYVCDNCGYACGTGGELRQHVAIHSDERPFVCKTCSKPFKTYANLKTHEDTHGETSYACFICSRVLNSRRTLRKHLLVHDDKARHVCSYCNKAFKRRQTLKVHMFTHTGDKPLTCKWCDERFSYASTLRSHRLRCHPDKMAPTDAGGSYQYIMDVQKSFAKDDRAAISIGTNES